ncbi:hypothetical protein K437DRAFT_126309 [Tilletiaria anomala UBC 951]|uniref:Uncharacterized protein n=1 Tax=Tilletiaria anomala (strain ATCC 24038 / CBS 436.72 / UBC 951) TaxID=1037660 RepID=A0A066VTP3_TILAU|nr:uncharacterized protein K437DRAFT_126309 [Tilletiaria anomala UBC 951]KDN45102.1 hypothetical protein K437DRAFT_126309 [Tilletiaria anomala UBC 951]
MRTYDLLQRWRGMSPFKSTSSSGVHGDPHAPQADAACSLDLVDFSARAHGRATFLPLVLVYSLGSLLIVFNVSHNYRLQLSKTGHLLCDNLNPVGKSTSLLARFAIDVE